MRRKFEKRTATNLSRLFNNKLKTSAEKVKLDPKRVREISQKGGIAAIWAADQSGCSWWRLEQPRLVLHYNQRATIQMFNRMQPDVEYLAKIDTFVLQRQMLDSQVDHLEFLRKVSKISGGRLLFDIDDICVGRDIPMFNAMREGFQSDRIFNSFKEAVNMCDELRVCSKYMAEYYKDKLDMPRVTVVPNYPSKMWYGGLYDEKKIEYNYNKNLKRPRVLWAGSATHVDVKGVNNGQDDFSHITQVVKRTVKEFRWVFFGAVPKDLEHYARQGLIEHYPWVNILNYPKRIAELNVQAVIAPLADNHFNRAKSNIKWIEAGCMGLNGVFQDLECYEDAKYKFKTGDDLIDQLRILLKNDYLNESSQIAKKMDESYFLDCPENMDLYYASFFTPYIGNIRRNISQKLHQLNV